MSEFAPNHTQITVSESVSVSRSKRECELVCDTDTLSSSSQEKMRTQWPLAELISLATETSLLPICIRWPNEVGFIHTQPSFRLAKIRHVLRCLDIPLLTTLSLRRHWIKENHKGKPESFLRLGTSAQKKTAATLFEEVVANHLDQLSVSYLTEFDQRQRTKGSPPAPTPDFLLDSPLWISTHPIHWIEVKHFYGAGTLPPHQQSACGKIPAKSQRYVELYGPGAYVFAYGCCEQLHAMMAEGVVVLDERMLLPYLQPLHNQLRTWCANERGEILP